MVIERLIFMEVGWGTGGGDFGGNGSVEWKAKQWIDLLWTEPTEYSSHQAGSSSRGYNEQFLVQLFC